MSRQYTYLVSAMQAWLEEFLAKEKLVNGVKDEPEQAGTGAEADNAADKAEAAPAGMQLL